MARAARSGQRRGPAQGRTRSVAVPQAPVRGARRPPGPPRRRQRRWVPLLALVAGASLLWLSRSHLLPPVPPPQLILVLGGDAAREQVAARLARADGLPVLVSSGSNPEYARWLFDRQGLAAGQVQLDYRAHDTLTNFTSLVDELRQAKVRHVLLVTSSDHMERAMLVGRIVAGSRGITLTPVPVPCGDRCQQEEAGKIWGDGFRALVWVVSGRDLRSWLEGASAPAPGAAVPDPAGH